MLLYVVKDELKKTSGARLILAWRRPSNFTTAFKVLLVVPRIHREAAPFYLKNESGPKHIVESGLDEPHGRNHGEFVLRSLTY